MFLNKYKIFKRLIALARKKIDSQMYLLLHSLPTNTAYCILKIIFLPDINLK